MRIFSSKSLIRLPLLFLLFGVIWIFITDRLLLWFIPLPREFGLWQTLKGWVFVGVSSIVVYLLVLSAVRQQKKAVFAQTAQEAEYELLFDHNPLPMWVYDLETLAFLAVNETAVRLYGYSRDEFLQMTLRDIRPPHEVERLMSDVAQSWPALNNAGEWQHRRKDGYTFPVEITSHSLVYNGRSARLVVAQNLTARKQTEAALLESEQRFRRAVEEAPFPIIIHAEDGEILTTSRSWTEITGYEPEEIPTISAWTERAYGNQQDTVQAGIDQLYLVDRRVDEGEFQITCKDGSPRTWQFSSTPLSPLPDGRRCVISMAVDMTDRKLAEMALRESEERYRNLFENNHVVMLLIDPHDGAIVDANPAAATYYGWTREELRQMTIRQINTLPPEEVAAQMERARREDLNYFFFRHRQADGSIRDVEVSSGAISLGGRQLLYSIVIDISARQKAIAEREELFVQVQAQAEQLTQIIRSVPEGVCLLDTAGVILTANPVALEQLALLSSVGIGEMLTHVADRSVDSLLTSPPIGEWHVVMLQDRIFRIISRPLESGPVPQGWVMVLWETTEQEMVQRQLQRQERLAAIGQLAAGIAHDFNNIMAVIVLYVQLLSSSLQLAEREEQRLATIEQQAQRAAQLIQQILDFSRRSVLERRPLDLLPLLKEEVKLLLRTLPEHVEISLNYEADDYFVQADPTRIEQMIMNLALNARDAMPAGGRLVFILDRLMTDTKRAPFPHMSPGSWVRLRVTDTGVGIIPEHLDHVFEPFFTTKQPGKGTGLGLAQVHGIVGQHGGHITVESEIGAGTVFTVYLPALTMEAPPLPTAHSSVIIQGNGERLLVVEDEAVLREALVDSLTRWQYQVLSAPDGESALATLSEEKGAIDLVISDVVMPRLGGVGLMRAIRQAGWQVPVILLSGHPLEEEKMLIQELGVVSLLVKPINLAQLSQAVAEILNKPEQP